MEATVIIAFVHLVTKGKSQVEKQKDFWAVIHSKSFKKNELLSFQSDPTKNVSIVPNMKERLTVLLWKSQALKTDSPCFCLRIIRPVLGPNILVIRHEPGSFL